MSLFSLLKRSGPQPLASDSHLLLIDFHPFSRGGHFGQYMHWFAREFCSRYDWVTALSPNAEVLEAHFRTYEMEIPANLRFGTLSRVDRKIFDLDRLARQHTSRFEQVEAFIMWGYDLQEFKRRRKPNLPWATMMGISWLHRGKREDNRARELALLEILKDDFCCKAFLQPDQFLNDRHEQSIWLPDIQPVERLVRDTQLVDRIRRHSERGLSIGCFGILTGLRCMDVLLQLAQAQPQVRFVAAGRLVEDSIRNDLHCLLEPGRLENLLIIPGFIDTEFELNSALCAVDGLLMDSSRYPVQSGMVSKALYHGLWLLSTEADSWTNDIIRQYRAGHVLGCFSDDLPSLYRTWQASGGPAAVQTLARELREPEKVAACFDSLCRRLRQT